MTIVDTKDYTFHLPEKSPIELLNIAVLEIAERIAEFSKRPFRDFTRNRKLNAKKLIRAILSLKSHFLNAELLEIFPEAGALMTASAFVQAREKLDPEAFLQLLYAFNRTMGSGELFHGYRLFAVDGTDISIPNSQCKDQEAKYVARPVGRPRKDGEPNKQVSQVHANCLYDLMNKVFLGCVLQPKNQENERKACMELLENLISLQTEIQQSVPHIVVLDRGYDGLNMVKMLDGMDGCRFVLRARCGNMDPETGKPSGHGVLKEIANLKSEESDTDVEITLSKSKNEVMEGLARGENWHLVNSQSDWDGVEFPCKVRFRMVKLRIQNPESSEDSWEVLLTNLPREEFPLEAMKDLYHARWGIETSFRHLKYAFDMLCFHGKKERFIEQEIYAHMVMFNLVSRHNSCIQLKQGKRKHAYMPDFSTAVFFVRKVFQDFKDFKDFKESRISLVSILEKIASYMHPVREGRHYKRRVKPKPARSFTYRSSS